MTKMAHCMGNCRNIDDHYFLLIAASEPGAFDNPDHIHTSKKTRETSSPQTRGDHARDRLKATSKGSHYRDDVFQRT